MPLFFVHAQSGFVPLAPIPGLTDPTNTSVVNSTSLANFFNNLYIYLIGLAAVIAIIEIIWGGLEISTQDSVSKHSDGKERIREAIIGLILVLAPVLVFSVINPSILNLSLNLPQLDTQKTTTSVSTGTAPATPTGSTTPLSGGTSPDCTVTGTLLKTAVCTTKEAAQDFASACTTGTGEVPFFAIGYKALCSTEKGSVTGPYSFADTSSGFWAKATGYSNFEPIVSTSDNPNNGAAVTQFAASCTADGGTTCLSAVKTPCASKIISLIVTNASAQSTSCWNMTLSCTNGNSGVGGCSSSPEFHPVTMQ